MTTVSWVAPKLLECSRAVRSQRNTQKRRGHFICGVREHSYACGGSACVLNADGHKLDTGTPSITGSMTGGGTVVVENAGELDCGGTITTDLSFAGSNVKVTLGASAQYHESLNEFGRGDTLILQSDIGSAASVVNSDTLSVNHGWLNRRIGPGGRRLAHRHRNKSQKVMM